MFFTRIAIAALSFGSVAKMFAAPIAIGVGAAPIAVVAELDVPGGVERRLDSTLPGLIATGTATLRDIKTRVANIVNNPTDIAATGLGPLLNQIAPIINGVTNKLEAAGVNTDSLLADVNGVKLTPDALGNNMATMLTVVDEILATAKGAAALNSLQAQVQEIKSQIAGLDAALNIVQQVKAIVAPVLAILQNTLVTVLDGIFGSLTGTLGLLAGIAPPA